MTNGTYYDIKIRLCAPPGQGMEIKEDIAAHLEQFGGAQVVSVEEAVPEQMTMDDQWRRGGSYGV